MDFSAFYTAGESLNAELSPYQNHISRTPPIWDGIAHFPHSRFLYPPLAATLFRPIALLPYAFAKYMWMGITLACVVLTMIIVGRLSKIPLQIESILIIGICVSLYYPLLTHLERGQIDAVILLPLVIAATIMAENKKGIISGLLLSIATLLKLYCVLFVPFLFLRRKWDVIVGYFAGGFSILVLSFFLNGADMLNNYFYEQLPRISAFGEGGPLETLLNERAFQEILSGIPAGYTLKDGVIYRIESFPITANGTLVRLLKGLLSKIGVTVKLSTLSLGVFMCFFTLLLIWHIRLKDKFAFLSPLQELAYWQVVVIVVLLSSPLTGSMNTIWLLPTITILIYWCVVVKQRAPNLLFFSLGVVGILVIAFSDEYLLALAHGNKLVDHKYVLGELSLLVSLLYFSSCSRSISKVAIE